MDDLRASLSRRLPGFEVRSVARLGEGLDHAAYEVNGALIVRISKEADPSLRAAVTRREADLLAVVAGLSTLPVPEPIFADPEAGVLAYARLPGLPLMHHPVADPSRLAPALGGFLDNLHRANSEEVEHLVERDTYPLAAWRYDAERDYQEIADRLPAAGRRLVEGFLGTPPPSDPRTLAFCHNDLGAEHLLVDPDTGALTGVIDWADAAVADPARDLAMAYRDLGPDVFDLTLNHYGCPFDDADRGRAAFYARCKLLEDAAYGFGGPDARPYAATALAHLDRTFA